MGQIQSPNQELLNKYLAEIGYSSVIANLPAEKKIVLDWERALGKVTDVAGIEWVRYKGKANIDFGANVFDVSGGYLASMRSTEKDYLTIDIYSMKSEKHALDYMLKLASLISAPKITAKFSRNPDCFADFCLVGRHTAETRARYVYGNMYVDVSGEGDNNTKSVIPIAKTIHQMMQAAERLAGKSTPSEPVLRLSLSQPSVKVGENITITIDVANLPAEDWATEVRIKGKNLETVDSRRGRYEYKAVSHGTETLKAILMNKRTLQFAEMERQINIAPESSK